LGFARAGLPFRDQRDREGGLLRLRPGPCRVLRGGSWEPFSSNFTRFFDCFSVS
jgi:hypothetical protein